MANPVKGEVAFEHGGKKYTFKLGFLALKSLEKKLNMPISKLFEEGNAQILGVTPIVEVFQAGMMRHQPAMTEADVTDLMDELGMDRVNEIFAEGVKLMSLGGSGTANPPTPAAPIAGANGNGQSKVCTLNG